MTGNYHNHKKVKWKGPFVKPHNYECCMLNQDTSYTKQLHIISQCMKTLCLPFKLSSINHKLKFKHLNTANYFKTKNDKLTVESNFRFSFLFVSASIFLLHSVLSIRLYYLPASVCYNFFHALIHCDVQFHGIHDCMYAVNEL